MNSIYHVLGRDPFGFSPAQVGEMSLAECYVLLAKPRDKSHDDYDAVFGGNGLDVEQYIANRRAMKAGVISG